MKFRIGVVGAGRIAVESHLPVLRSLENVDVVGLCDQRTDVAREVASQFDVDRVFADLGEMLVKEKPDLIEICTPPYTHAPVAMQAMESGCHVLVEKPMATSVVEADKMIGSMKKNDVTLCVVHQNLYNPVVVKARTMVESGAVGDLLNVEVRTFERRNSEMCLDENHWCHKLPGGIFYEILPHPTYLLQSFLKDVNSIDVTSTKFGNVKWIPKDEVRVLVEAKNGFGSIVSSCNSLISGDWLDILGTKMGLQADLFGRTIITYRPRMQSSALSVGKSNLQLSAQLFKVLGSTALTTLKALRGTVRVSAHYPAISESIYSIRNNTKPPVTAEDGRETVKMLETVCRQINE